MYLGGKFMDNLEERLNEFTAQSDGKLFANAEVEVSIRKEEPIETLEVDTIEPTLEEQETLAMNKLGEFESKEREKIKLTEELEGLTAEYDTLLVELNNANKELVDKIEDIKNRLEVIGETQETIKEELLPLQSKLFAMDETRKTLVYNKVQSTYVAQTEKNKFDLKKFREDHGDFFNEHKDIMGPYSDISIVSDYLKITIKK